MLVETMEAIDTAADEWKATAAIVVLHAGLSDIRGNDSPPHDTAERLKSQITIWKERAKGHFFVVYGVPEVGPRDDALRVKCESWNRSLHQVCSDVGTRVEFMSVTKVLQDKMRDTAYSEASTGGQPSTEDMGGKPNYHHYISGGTGNTADGKSAEAPEVILAQELKKETARRRSIRKGTRDVHVGFLNLHGARTASKWEELYRMMDDEDMELYAVAETHLRAMEEPPVQKGWQWSGLNRPSESRKGGGIGVLWRTGTDWRRVNCSCTEHMWVEGYLQGLPVLVGVAYFAVSAGTHAGNSGMTQCIVEDVTRWATQREVLIMGDFNGHLQALDGFQDANGELLMTLAHTLALDVVNLRPDCAGQYTWCARNSRSCIDYALVTSALSLQLTGMNIDESGQFSLGSDHNRIKLTISRSSWRTNPKERRNPSKRYLPQSAYEAIAEEFEQHFRPTVTPSYEQFVCELRRYMKKHEIRVNSRGGVKRKGWWTKKCKKLLSQDEQRTAFTERLLNHPPQKSAYGHGRNISV
ncbi:hypothetical protein HPB49_019141 [Dermacentor silvarum]|uniref:Uncharacterized protein n=1 Tax=Dermacentor silvarum TaxID=543639 RepID=A0ACB8CZF3_DERSI|nr:hypothetical protein HPB49_019141 [Dermacentor silvarum]